MSNVLAGSYDLDEKLPVVSRPLGSNPLTFRVTARDGLGGVSDDVVQVGVENTGNPFQFFGVVDNIGTSTNGSAVIVNWNVAGTNAGAIDTPMVDFYISYDGGSTWVLTGPSKPNTGVASVQIPLNSPFTTTARLKIKGHDNYFFDVNNNNFTVSGNLGVTALPAIAPPANFTINANRLGDLADIELPILGADAFINSPGDSDTFLFSPDSTDLYTISAGDIVGSGNNVDTVMVVYDDLTGQRIALNDDVNSANRDSQVKLWLEQDHLYRIAIADYGNNDTGDAYLTISSNQDIFPTPLTLNTAGKAGAADNLDTALDVDLFSFNVPANATGSGVIDFTGNPGNLVLSLYDINDKLVAHATDGALDSEMPSLTPGSRYTVRVGTNHYRAGGGLYNLEIDLELDTTPGTPTTAPDLLSSDDSGISSMDNITNAPNGSLTLAAFASSSTTGRFVRLYRDGVLIAGPQQAAPGLDYALFDVPAAPLAEGDHVFTSTAANTATGSESGMSPPLTVTLDRVAPRPTAFDFVYDLIAQDQLFYIDFTESLKGFTADDIAMVNQTTGASLPTTAFDVVLDSAGPGTNDVYYDATNANDRVPSGDYRVVVPAGSAADVAGNANTPFLANFFFLDGDANRDRVVDLADFVILRNNFSSSNALFSQGDFNYDGNVDLQDFVILRNNFGTILPGPDDDE